jgi:hypothetical protein
LLIARFGHSTEGKNGAKTDFRGATIQRQSPIQPIFRRPLSTDRVRAAAGTVKPLISGPDRK